MKSLCVQGITVKVTKMDSYAKDWDQGRCDFCVGFYHESLHTSIKKDLNKFAISSHMPLKLGRHVQALKSYLKITHEFRLHILPN